jgi:hypothetical protein
MTKGALSSPWMDIQGEFVDEPCQTIEGADEVADLMNLVTESFSAHRMSLENQWADVSTEQMLQSPRLYWTFFNRLFAW